MSAQGSGGHTDRTPCLPRLPTADTAGRRTDDATTKNPRSGFLRSGGSLESTHSRKRLPLCARGDLNPHVPKDTGT
ncbi:protein of unknown function [Streptomyces sp. KY75]|nr:protein of unknown function [Streptomyces sp. KY75]CAD5972581.1 protein of unknown function [Streptomyces sp. KY70]